MCSCPLLLLGEDRLRLAAAFSPAGALLWQIGKVLMADRAEGVELKITKR